MIENRGQYIRTQMLRWDFYYAIEGLKAKPLTDPSLDPKMNEIFEQAMLSQIADLEVEIAEYEKAHPSD